MRLLSPLPAYETEARTLSMVNMLKGAPIRRFSNASRCFFVTVTCSRCALRLAFCLDARNWYRGLTLSNRRAGSHEFTQWARVEIQVKAASSRWVLYHDGSVDCGPCLDAIQKETGRIPR